MDRADAPRRRYGVLLPAIVAGLVVSATAARAAPRTARAPRIGTLSQMQQQVPPADPGRGGGEGMTYDILVGPLKVGRAALAIGKPAGQHRQAVNVRGRAETLRLVGKLLSFSEEQVTTVDLASLRPLRSTLLTRKHDQVNTTKTDYATSRKRRTRQRIVRGTNKRLRERRLPPGSLDPFSALLRLRALDLRPGATRQLTVLSGTKLYRVKVAVVGHESLTVGGKKRRALRLDATARRITDRARIIRRYRPASLTLWFSADSSRIPLAARLENKLGSFGLRLSAYHPPARPTRKAKATQLGVRRSPALPTRWGLRDQPARD